VLVLPGFDATGNLPPGVHFATWKQIVDRLGFTERRIRLLSGLREALDLLRTAGCLLVFLDGSFATSKPEPGDFDACWAMDGVDVELLDPVFLDFSNARARQKGRFGGEFFPAELPEGMSGKTFLEFFQTDKETGRAKGIVAIHLTKHA